MTGPGVVRAHHIGRRHRGLLELWAVRGGDQRRLAATWDRRPLADPRLRAAFAAVWDHLVVEDGAAASDALVCFGSRHARVPDVASHLLRRGHAPLAVVTGGPSSPGEEPEAHRFARSMIARGVSPDALIIEPRARHTGENVELALAALAATTAITSVTLVCWPLASLRCRATMIRHAPEMEVRTVPALRRPGHRWAATPRRVRFALGELDRLERYGRAGWLAPVERPAEVADAIGALRRWSPRPDAADHLPPGRIETLDAGLPAQQGALLRSEL